MVVAGLQGWKCVTGVSRVAFQGFQQLWMLLGSVGISLLSLVCSVRVRVRIKWNRCEQSGILVCLCIGW